MDTKEIIREILEDMHSDVDYDMELADEFGIQITAKEFVEENFNSLAALTAMVDRLMEE